MRRENCRKFEQPQLQELVMLLPVSTQVLSINVHSEEIWGHITQKPSDLQAQLAAASPPCPWCQLRTLLAQDLS